MYAEGQVFCPMCGQPESIRFRMGSVQYATSICVSSRKLSVHTEAGADCPTDDPGFSS